MDPKNPNTTSGSFPENPGDSPEESLRRATEAEQEATSLVEAAAPGIPQETPKPNPFVTQSVAQLVAAGLNLSKKAGWSSPEAPPVLTEEMWAAAVAENTAIVIARHFPRLNDAASEEFTLIVLVLPWLLANIGGLLWKRFTAKDSSSSGKIPEKAESLQSQAA